MKGLVGMCVPKNGFMSSITPAVTLLFLYSNLGSLQINNEKTKAAEQ